MVWLHRIDPVAIPWKVERPRANNFYSSRYSEVVRLVAESTWPPQQTQLSEGRTTSNTISTSPMGTARLAPDDHPINPPVLRKGRPDEGCTLVHFACHDIEDAIERARGEWTPVPRQSTLLEIVRCRRAVASPQWTPLSLHTRQRQSLGRGRCRNSAVGGLRRRHRYNVVHQRPRRASRGRGRG